MKIANTKKRIHIEVPVLIASKGKYISTKSLSISENGLVILSPEPIDLFTVEDIKIIIAFRFAISNALTLDLEAVVVDCKKISSEGQFRVTLWFSSLTDITRKLLCGSIPKLAT